MAAASSPQLHDLEYLYASNANVSNFISMKLSGKHDYHRWKTQMLCLMEAHFMRCLVDDVSVNTPTPSSERIKKQYDNLLKGWIFGSVSDGVLDTVVDLGSAKDVWDTLKSLYELDSTKDVQPTMTSQEGPEEIETQSEHVISKDIEAAGKDATSKEAQTVPEEEKTENKKLRKATWEGSWRKVKHILEKDKDALKRPLDGSGSTPLHIAVAMGYTDLVKKLLLFIEKEDVKEILEQKNGDGSTALHIAVCVGNEHALKLLVEKNKDLLTISDKRGQDPLIKALNNMQFDTFLYLFKAAVANNKTKGLVIFQGRDHKEKGASLLVNAITAKQYATALELIKEFPEFAVQNDEVLMAIARTFPSELKYWEELVYPTRKFPTHRISATYVNAYNC
ncbi:hypothetical protein OSB04_014972 [Centaurea solstitialis]|uniref:Uncharacterized protein n=1 Tax=Centaurea solstitialis TaxID=347529 RepID=A0AA38W6Z2_9ASTR|nr:hypothetical protein OSB04_014972 [Centaurea solstitialis]